MKGWNDPNLLEIPAKTIDGPRSLLIGRINNRHCRLLNTPCYLF